MMGKPFGGVEVDEESEDTSDDSFVIVMCEEWTTSGLRGVG